MAQDAHTNETLAPPAEEEEEDGLVFTDQVGSDDAAGPDWASGPEAGPGLSAEEKAKILAPRVVVKRPEPAPLPTEFFAYCPACEAKNHVRAALCGRCGVEIPPSVPSVGVGGSQRGFNVARKGFEGEVYVPEPVQERLDERRAEQDARVQARKTRYRWRRWGATLGGGGFFGVLGGGVNASFYAILVDPSLAERFLIATLITVCAGLFVGHRLFKRGGGRFNGTLLYGGAALLSIGSMLILGGHNVFGGHDSNLTGSLAGALFIFPICFLLFSMCIGSMMGLSIELQNSDD